MSVWRTSHPWLQCFGVSKASNGSPAPAFYHSEGGSLAVYGECPAAHRLAQTPWLVVHGGPGGRINRSLVAALRQFGLGWYGADQRNSGLSEDLPLSEIDLQRLVDDILALTERFGFERINVLAGSWGATVALLLATQQPDRIGHLVIRAPFLPFPERIEHFFAQLEALTPVVFADVFGAGARTAEVCDRLLNFAQPEAQAIAALLWRDLEESLLNVRPVSQVSSPAKALQLSMVERVQLVRKYTLQSHFLWHGCFWPKAQVLADLVAIDAARLKVVILQGQKDRVCPPDGAQWLRTHLTLAQLIEMPHAGHLASGDEMSKALSEVVARIIG